MPNGTDARLVHAADHCLGKDESALTIQERAILEQVIGKRALSRDPNAGFDGQFTTGQ